MTLVAASMDAPDLPKPDPTPIPLRSLIVLCNYERTTTYPWLSKDAELQSVATYNFEVVPKSELSSLLDLQYYYGLDKGGNKVQMTAAAVRDFVEKIPSSIVRMRTYVWQHNCSRGHWKPSPGHTKYFDPPLHRPIARVADFLAPNPNQPATPPLTDRKLEFIFHETRGPNGCAFSVRLFRHFTELCPENQKYSIQLTNEEPSLVDKTSFKAMRVKCHRPKTLSVSRCRQAHEHEDWRVFKPMHMPPFLTFGSKASHDRWVLLFPEPGDNRKIVVDMSRLAYGEEGLGPDNEPYFIGTEQEFFSQSHNVCEGGYEFWVSVSTKVPWTHIRCGWDHDTSEAWGPESMEDLWLYECAQRVLKRWNKRDKEPWCEYCGAGVAPDGSKLFKCPCSMPVWYCCKDHKIQGWKLHRYLCDYRRIPSAQAVTVPEEQQPEQSELSKQREVLEEQTHAFENQEQQSEQSKKSLPSIQRDVLEERILAYEKKERLKESMQREILEERILAYEKKERLKESMQREILEERILA